MDKSIKFRFTIWVDHDTTNEELRQWINEKYAMFPEATDWDFSIGFKSDPDKENPQRFIKRPRYSSHNV